jgi:hypothetical protein
MLYEPHSYIIGTRALVLDHWHPSPHVGSLAPEPSCWILGALLDFLRYYDHLQPFIALMVDHRRPLVLHRDYDHPTLAPNRALVLDHRRPFGLTTRLWVRVRVRVRVDVRVRCLKATLTPASSTPAFAAV